MLKILRYSHECKRYRVKLAVQLMNVMKGSLHRKQKNSYETSGRNPTDLDLLDEGSEEEIQSLTLEERANVFRFRGWLVDTRN